MTKIATRRELVLALIIVALVGLIGLRSPVFVSFDNLRFVVTDTSVLVKDEKVYDFDLKHCKGCGVCAKECPFDAIQMVPEGCDIPEVK